MSSTGPGRREHSGAFAGLRFYFSRISRSVFSLLQILVASLQRRQPTVVVDISDLSPVERGSFEKALAFYFRATESRRGQLIVRRTPRVSLLSALSSDAVMFPTDSASRRLLQPLLRHAYYVSMQHNADAAWEFSAASERLLGIAGGFASAEVRPRLATAVADSKARFGDQVYLFGTGPSLANAAARSFSDGCVVVCNTIVRDETLWRHLNPNFIVAGDAIYHFGDNRHSDLFRADLRARLRQSAGRCLFLYPRLFASIIESELGDCAELCLPVPVGMHQDPCVDLLNRFQLPALGNVLNLLLLPLGCTLGRSIGLWGFDGRAPNDQLFWANSSRHSYPEAMEDLRREYPAFFQANVPKGNEHKYVQSVHGDALEASLSAAEGRGYRFEMLHASWTPVLQRRLAAGVEGRP